MAAKIIAFFNNKGGVGKTTLCVNIASFLAETYKVLLIDLDPQANATAHLSAHMNSNTVSHAFAGKLEAFQFVDFSEIIKSVTSLKDKLHKNFWILPGAYSLRDIEKDIMNHPEGRSLLGKNIKDKLNEFDFVFIDCPPAINIFSWNGLFLADHVIIPFKPGRSELDGVVNLNRVLREINDQGHPVNILGVLINMYTNTYISNFFIRQISGIFSEDKIFDVIISASVRYLEATSLGLPVDLYLNPTSKHIAAYRELTAEIEKRLSMEVPV